MKRRFAVLLSVAALLFAGLGMDGRSYCCKYCGWKANSVAALTSMKCRLHPDGPYKGRHAPYEGAESKTYCCRYCGWKATSVAALTSMKCRLHPDGPYKGRHAPVAARP